MAKKRSAVREFLVVSVSILVAIVTGLAWIGEPLRQVQVITLVALGMASGVALERARIRLRQERKAKTDAPSADAGADPSRPATYDQR